MSVQFIEVLLHSFRETLSVVMLSGAAGVLAGIPLGMCLFIEKIRLEEAASGTSCGGIARFCVHCVRTTPAIVVLVFAMTALHYLPVALPAGLSTALPLALLATLFIARKTESALAKVDPSLVETARGSGASEMQILRTVLLPESRAELIASTGLALSALVGYAAVVGAIVGNGLGGLGIRYGFHEFLPEAMLIVVGMLLAMAEAAQYSAAALARHFDS